MGIESYSVEQLGSWDSFFYYGSNPIDYENQSDALQLGLQPKRSLYYFNQYSCKIADYENYPNAFAMQIGLRYSIALGFSYRNQYVSDGQNDRPDRRLAVSQNSVSFLVNGGDISVNIYYISYSNYKKPQSITVPVGGMK